MHPSGIQSASAVTCAARETATCPATAIPGALAGKSPPPAAPTPCLRSPRGGGRSWDRRRCGIRRQRAATTALRSMTWVKVYDLVHPLVGGQPDSQISAPRIMTRRVATGGGEVRRPEGRRYRSRPCGARRQLCVDARAPIVVLWTDAFIVSIKRRCVRTLHGGPGEVKCAGAGSGTKETYIEHVASHDGPGSCAGAREGRRRSIGRGTRRQGHGTAKSHRSGCRRRPRERKATRPGGPARAPGQPRAVEDPVHARTLRAREPGGPLAARPRWRGGTTREGQGHKPRMNGQGTSDRPVVPTKRATWGCSLPPLLALANFLTVLAPVNVTT
jgi:hypothetical protein